jgi:Protein of unknown function (DUF2590)
VAGEYDLELVSGDLAFGPDGEPRFLAGAAAIAQDVKHRLIESGLAAELVADEAEPDAALAAIAFAVEEDERIRPGSARPEIAAAGQITVTARTLDGAPITQAVTTQG